MASRDGSQPTDRTPPLILCYHAVSADWASPLAVKPSELDRQVSLLLSRGWKATTFSRAVLSEPSAQRTFAITFDDAYLSVLDLALPVLSGLGVPATVFAPTAFMDRHQTLKWPGIEPWAFGPQSAELRSMDWDDLRELAHHGWEVGSHTRSHRHLGGLSDADLERELLDSRVICGEQLQTPCKSLAYPYGYADVRAVEWARRAGYRTAAILSDWFTPRTTDPLMYPRVGVYRADALWRFRLKLSPVHDVLDRWRGEPGR